MIGAREAGILRRAAGRSPKRESTNEEEIALAKVLEARGLLRIVPIDPPADLALASQMSAGLLEVQWLSTEITDDGLRELDAYRPRTVFIAGFSVLRRLYDAQREFSRALERLANGRATLADVAQLEPLASLFQLPWRDMFPELDDAQALEPAADRGES